VRWRTKPEGEAADDRWQGRPVLAALVSTTVFLVPITTSIVVATVVAHVLPRPHGVGWLVGWWVMILAVPTAVLFVTDRLARRALPLAVLLKMTLVFPDSAPRRLAVARKAGNTRDLARRVMEARTQGIEDEPVLAAEKILALAGTLNTHDRLTRGHGERVRALTDLIADELDLPADDRDRLRWSALLHDIGKIAVHPDILNKAGTLNDAEWAVIKNHPLEGAKLTAPLAGWLGPWANTIAEHHEKFDGSGYPFGLSAQEISFGGRIVAVADAYDTMTAVRSYKKTMSPQAARAELAACAGTHFDPQVVRAFLDVSIGRLRVVAGPITWLGSLPFVSSVPQLGQVAATAGRVAAASVAVGGAVTAGSIHAAQSASPTLSALSVSAGAGPGQGTGASRSGGGKASGTTTPTTTTSTTTTSTTTTSTTTTSTGSGSSGAGSRGAGSGGTGTDSSGSNEGGSGGNGSMDTTTTTRPSTTTTTTRPSTTTTTTTTPGATRPSAPTGVSAVAGDHQVTVSWSAPSNGGSPITSYTVTPYIGGVAQAPHAFGSSATPQVVSGLTDGTTYTFKVVATNAVGSSLPSTASQAVTPRITASLTLVSGSNGDGWIDVVPTSPPPTGTINWSASTILGPLSGAGSLVSDGKGGWGLDTGFSYSFLMNVHQFYSATASYSGDANYSTVTGGF
jgi:hypothetical protein